MCYHFSINKSKDYLEKRFAAKFKQPQLFKPIYYASGFEAPRLPVITNQLPQQIQMINWGLIPNWIKDQAQAQTIRDKTLNARADTIFSKPSYQQAIKKQRCLVLADGFYDWREFKGKKYPYYITLLNDQAFAFAGIWDNWQDSQTKESILTFSIITTEANELVARIHNIKQRMPVILEPAEEKLWLETDLPMEAITGLMDPYDTDKMKAHPISKLISARGLEKNLPAIIQAHNYPELTPLN